jgi:uncharacterized membrane protein
MKGKLMHGFVPAAGLLASITCFGADAPQPAAQTLYRIADLPGLGGTNSAGNSISNTRLVAGYSNLTGDQTRHAAAWLHGLPFDLGTLGGPNSNVAWPVKNKRGLIAGIAETAQPDPLGEAWSCSAFFPTTTHQQCLGFAWQLGHLRALPTLGGNNGFATGVDNHGRIVGWAENTVHDPTCNPPQVLQFRAVIWGPEPNRIQELPPLGGDTVSSATAINADGQVAGISGICSNAVGEYSAAHAVVWQSGQPHDLGNIGGVAWNTPMAINNAGVVVGFANVPGAPDPADFNAHAFVWTQAASMQDIHGFPDDAFSQALGINAR